MWGRCLAAALWLQAFALGTHGLVLLERSDAKLRREWVQHQILDGGFKRPKKHHHRHPLLMLHIQHEPHSWPSDGPSRDRGKSKPTIFVRGTLGPKLRAGLCNQLETFVSLVRYAARENADISLRGLDWRGDWKTNDLVPHELIWDVEHWNQDELLPKLVEGTPCRRCKTWGVHVASLWQERMVYYDELQEDLNLERDFYEARVLQRLRPVQAIRDVLQAVTPPEPYGALHARVEDDLAVQLSMLEARVGLARIFHNMESSPSLHALVSDNVRSKLFVAVSNDVDNETKATLASGRGPWGSRIIRSGVDAVKGMQQFNGSHYLVASMVDFEICRQAEYFVGFSPSSFSNMVTVSRLVDGRRTNFYYNMDVVAPRCDGGRLGNELLLASFTYAHLNVTCKARQDIELQ